MIIPSYFFEFGQLSKEIIEYRCNERVSKDHLYNYYHYNDYCNYQDNI